jgi:Carboxypeptidase regulatory-like domain
MGASPLRHPVRLRAWALAASALAGLAFAPAPARAEAGPGVAGRVLADTQPVADATVYAYQVVEKTLRQALTDGSGRFRFADLPAGLYKIIAHKSGFAPAVTVVTRRAADENQFVQVELPAGEDPGDAESFWELRGEVPSDVLRDLEAPLSDQVVSLVPAESDAATLASRYLTQVAASTSMSSAISDTQAQIVSGQVGLRGRVGKMDLAVNGDFRSLGRDARLAEPTGPSLAGEATALKVALAAPEAGRFDLAAETHRVVTTTGASESPVDFERFQFRYRRDLGDDSSTALMAQYVDETGIYGGRRVHPQDLPLASRALRLEGSYARDLGDDTKLRAGLRYRESVFDYATRRAGVTGDPVLDRSVDVWSFADWNIDPTYVVQYGLFTTAHDGVVSLAPRGGLVVHIHPDLQLSASATKRIAVSEDPSVLGEFVPTTLGSALACEDAEASCYELQLLHGDGEANHVQIGGSWREFDRTVRLFMQDDLFAADEGLFLVPGDQVPEVHATVRRELGDTVVATLTTSYADGGGGAFRAANQRVYRNDVAYMTTSLDTTIRPTSTGVYIAFHRVQQGLERYTRGRLRPATSAQLDRLEIAVSQNLAGLFHFASDWAVRVGVELLRGDTLFDTLPVDSSELRHRVTTGVAVRF